MMARKETPYNFESVEKEEAANRRFQATIEQQQRQELATVESMQASNVAKAYKYIVCAYGDTLQADAQQAVRRAAQAWILVEDFARREMPQAKDRGTTGMREFVKRAREQMADVLKAFDELDDLAIEHSPLPFEP
jgi:hypothetical protein